MYPIFPGDGKVLYDEIYSHDHYIEFICVFDMK